VIFFIPLHPLGQLLFFDSHLNLIGVKIAFVIVWIGNGKWAAANFNFWLEFSAGTHWLTKI